MSSSSLIQSQINSLQRERDSCIRDRNSYRNALNYAEKELSSLNSADKYLESSIDDLSKYFVINNKTADNDRLKNCRNTIKQISSKLKNTIIPSINGEIRNLENEISSLEREIANLQRELKAAQAKMEVL